MLAFDVHFAKLKLIAYDLEKQSTVGPLVGEAGGGGETLEWQYGVFSVTLDINVVELFPLLSLSLSLTHTHTHTYCVSHSAS
jgi:hypothetical protein